MDRLLKCRVHAGDSVNSDTVNGCIPLRIDRYVCVCVYPWGCASTQARFLLSLIPRGLFFARHSGLSDRAFTPSNSYRAASAGRDIYLNGSKTSPSLVPAETQYKRRGKEFYGASDSTLAKSRLIAILYAGTCARTVRADVKRIVSFNFHRYGIPFSYPQMLNTPVKIRISHPVIWEKRTATCETRDVQTGGISKAQRS